MNIESRREKLHVVRNASDQGCESVGGCCGFFFASSLDLHSLFFISLFIHPEKETERESVCVFLQRAERKRDDK